MTPNNMISLAEARAIIAQNISPLPPQPAALAMACARVLREDIHADADLPAFDRSAMDGYAVGLDDASEKFRIVGEIQPGVSPSFKINHGECARIFTGAQIPDGASQVLMQENVRVENGFIIPTQRSPVLHIRRRGEDARKGGLLLKAGTKLGAGELALLASLGVVSPKVSPPVRVAHFVTGNELVAPSQQPAAGQIRDSNSTLVAALVQEFGGEISQQETVVDDFDLLLGKVRNAEDNFDLLLVSGGASVGDYDFGKKLLGALGFTVHFEKINLRPGKPLVFATRERGSGTGVSPVVFQENISETGQARRLSHYAQAAFILPGNPVSHFVTLHVAVRLALEKFSGASLVAQASSLWVHQPGGQTHRLEACATTDLPLINLKLAADFDYRPDARETFWPARVEIQNGELVVRALRWQSSGDVTGLTGVNALIRFDGKAAMPKAGEAVLVLLLEGLAG